MHAIYLLAAFAQLGSLLQVAYAASAHSALRSTASYIEEKDLNERQPSVTSPDSWLGWGANIYNNRWAASDAQVDASNVASLQSVCKLEYTIGESAPALVVHGIAYYPTWSGLLVALDYRRCKVVWQANITSYVVQYGPSSPVASFVPKVSRTTPALYKDRLFLGSLNNALLLAVDKRDGKLVDTIKINDHPLAVLTTSPTIYKGVVFVGASSSEELGAAIIPGYVCCSFIGSANGFILEDDRFKLLWSQPMIPAGSNFSGGAVWGGQPPIDPKREYVFFATGNVYSVPTSYEACVNATTNTTSPNPANATDPCAPREVYQEAVLAFDYKSGKIVWSHQLTPTDAWNVACIKGFPGVIQNPGSCPPNPGPDADFGMAPSFVPGAKYTPDHEDTLIVGQKNGNLYALAASDGSLFWATPTSPDGTQGGLIWGLAVDAKVAYYTAANSNRKPWKLQDGTQLSNSAFGAADITTGKILWETVVPRNDSSLVQPTVVNDLVLVGDGGPAGASINQSVGAGSFIALDKFTGSILEDRKLDAQFHAGIAVVHDYIMFGTGYETTGTPNGTFNVWRLKK